MAKTTKKKAKKKTAAKKKKVKSKPKTKAKAKKEKTGIKRGKGGLFAKGTKAGGRKTTLTTTIAIQLARMWRHKISDQIACDVIGITKNQLKQWLRTNQIVSITVKRTVGEKETLFEEKIGLQHLRTRERGMILCDYIELHKKAIEGAMDSEKYGDALRGIEFMMEKQFPRQFGKDPGGEDEDKPKAIKFPLAPPPKKKKPVSKTSKKSKK